jgi:transposase-like protein
VREIAAMLKAIHASEHVAAVREKATRVIEKLRGMGLTKAAELADAGVEETLSYYAFPEEHWRRIRTSDPLERLLREIRRRTRVVGAFPDGQSALNLAAVRLRRVVAGTARSAKRYLNIELLKDQQMRGAINRLSDAHWDPARTRVAKPRFLISVPMRIAANRFPPFCRKRRLLEKVRLSWHEIPRRHLG